VSDTAPAARGLSVTEPLRQVFDETLGRASVDARLKGRTILVVGAGQRPSPDHPPPLGNGRAIALLCAKAGAEVACADRDRLALDETLARIDESGGRARGYVVDVSEPEAIEPVVHACVAEMGQIDGMVLNVGIGGPLGLANQSAEEWDAVLAVNLRSPMLFCKAALPRMAPGGAIVFVSSTASIRPGTRNPSYDASKAALAALCRHVALEGEPLGIRANVIAPGPIDTPLGREASRNRPARATQRLAFGREGTAWEVAYVTLFLLSRESSLINAQVIVADGGMTGMQLR
jgi:NAD(P)-dependent dehydrogenase (short-subunit alcohol dehydrogenase family)